MPCVSQPPAPAPCVFAVCLRNITARIVHISCIPPPLFVMGWTIFPPRLGCSIVHETACVRSGCPLPGGGGGVVPLISDAGRSPPDYFLHCKSTRGSPSEVVSVMSAMEMLTMPTSRPWFTPHATPSANHACRTQPRAHHTCVVHVVRRARQTGGRGQGGSSVT